MVERQGIKARLWDKGIMICQADQAMLRYESLAKTERLHLMKAYFTTGI